jgi:hypothetical protein
MRLHGREKGVKRKGRNGGRLRVKRERAPEKSPGARAMRASLALPPALVSPVEHHESYETRPEEQKRAGRGNEAEVC